MEKPDPFLRTKLHLPFIRKNLVPRLRLREQIRQGLSGPLTLVIAPAGFGKTTLVASCLASCGMAVAWLSLDKDDNQPGRFLNYLIATLQTSDARVGKDAAKLLAVDHQVSPEAVLTSLINDLDAANAEIVLALDDYQFMSSTAVHEQVSFLLEHCPNTFHLMIATRSDPPLPLGRFRARGQMLELRAADLRFTESEADQFLNDVMGLDLDTGSVAMLEERTEGWIVGLQMAALSMRDRKDGLEFIQGFSGTNRYILDYLLEEVLGGQSPEVQYFLLCTSVLERLTAPLCDALLEREVNARGEDQASHSEQLLVSPSASILEYLERANIFVLPVDDERRWYRYHHLFRDLLRARLAHSPYRQYQKLLHARASIWYETYDFPEEAIHHALAAEDYLAAARLIEGIAENAWLNGQYANLLAWISALPQTLVRSRPWLCIWNAWVYTQLGILENIQQWIEITEQSVTNESPDLESLINEIAALKVFAVSFAQDYDLAIPLAEDVLKGPPLKHQKAAQFIRCNILHLLSSMYFTTGQISRAEQTCLETIELAKKIGFTLRYLHAINKLILIYKITGRLTRAARMLEEAELMLREEESHNYFAALQLYFRRLELLYEKNQLDDVQNLFDLILKRETMVEVPYLRVDFYNIQAHILLTRQDYRGSQNALNRAMALARQTYIWEGLAWRTEWLQIHLWLKKGDVSSAIAWESQHVQDPSGVIPFSGEARMIGRARILLAKGACHDAITLLNRLSDSAHMGGRTGSLIEIRVLKAIALQNAGNLDQAIAEIDHAFALAEPEGYIRTFIDEGKAMQILISQWLARAGTSPLRGYALHLFSQFDSEPCQIRLEQEKSSANGDLVEPLTPRELEILRFVAAGLSNRQIAAKLFLAEGTVKFYVHAILQKLGVHSRTQALVVAREGNLL
jgi:ATP/maltotriose-dependent transcriptional regulator MalT